MPVEAKPLFRPDVLRSYLARFSPPPNAEASRLKFRRWSEMLRSGEADRLGERELLPDFITDLFVDLLGYQPPPGLDGRFTLSRERHVQVDGQFADAVLGRFGGGRSEFVMVVEGKGPTDPLDRPHAGRRMSAVDQGYRYAINLLCDWVIVTSVRQTRLYYKGADQQTYERFDTERLAEDPAQLKKLVFLLGAERVLPEGRRNHLYELLSASERAGRELTKAYYRTYADMRQNAFERLCAANPSADREIVLTATQRILDRTLFCAFCEDRGLLPADSLRRAYEHADPYNPRPIWDNFRGLFQAVNNGSQRLAIPRFNGGLFADDAHLDSLLVPDEVCNLLKQLGDYDYRPAAEAAQDASAAAPGADTDAHLIDVDILGHIFEQSISDLERIRGDLGAIAAGSGTAPADATNHPSRRKTEGAFYTPSFITRYIIEQALGGVLAERFERLRAAHEESASRAAKSALADPRAYDRASLKPAQIEALVKFWSEWQTELASIKLLDPSCGSGAFLVEAFDQLYTAYEQTNDRLADLRGTRTLFDLDKQILQHNLYGVDLNEEAVEICRLSLWIKTAQRGKELTSLDHSIRAGNSVVDDPAVHPRAFRWQAEFPEVFAAGGFDVVVGNPPYVRQELLSAIKPHLQGRFASYHGMADLYVYFYELGLRLLKPGGKLSLVVTNKWLKAGYAEPLRRHLAEQSWVESLVDFGHAKQIFEDADVFPCILVTQKPKAEASAPTLRVCSIPREQLRIEDLSRQIATEGFTIESGRLGADAWQLEQPGVIRLLAKIRQAGVPLSEFVGSKPLIGIKTGFNEAFLVDTRTRDRLIAADPNCAALIKPFLRGQDVERWSASWAGLWMIAIKSSENHAWPWSGATGDAAEQAFLQACPSLHAHLKVHQAPLIKRQDKGRFWWELRSCAYWDKFEQPKITYQEIQFHPWYGYSPAGTCGNNKTFILPTNDLWLLAVLNSPLIWWHNWRYLPHMKDEALSPVGFLMENLPIAKPTAQQREEAEPLVEKLINLAKQRREVTLLVLDWLRVEFEVVKPTMKLQSPLSLNADTFVSEVRKVRGKGKPLTATGLKTLTDEFTRTVTPAAAVAGKVPPLERQVSDQVNTAYRLTPEEVTLFWDTAPPRMPSGRP